MKKIFSALVVVFSIASFCRAQDTVQYMDSCYLFNERHPYTIYPWPPLFDGTDTNVLYFNPILWGWDKFCSTNYDGGHQISYGYPRTSQQEPVMVYGVALTVTGYNGAILKEDDLEKYPYDVVLGRVENNVYVVVDSTTWDSRKDAIASFKYTMLGDGVLYEHVVPVYEFYFDSPHLITDTFYVGFRRTVPESTFPDRKINLICSVDSASTLWVFYDDVQRYRNRRQYAWGGEFPILQPNRHCGVPSAPHLTVYNATNTVRFTLPYSPGDSLLLSIADFGQSADSGTIYPVTDSILEIVIPDSGRYSARLGRICPRYGGLMLQSDWSTPTNFFIMSNLDIAQPQEGDAVRLLLFPNPASGTVTVGGFEGEGSVEIVDMAGRVSGQWPVAGGQRTIDISRLPAGSYVVRLTTAEGTASRMLQVE